MDDYGYPYEDNADTHEDREAFLADYRRRILTRTEQVRAQQQRRGRYIAAHEENAARERDFAEAEQLLARDLADTVDQWTGEVWPNLDPWRWVFEAERIA